jgi:hypothetical protein
MAAPKKKEAPPVEEPAPQIAIDKIKSETISVPIVGTSPLIVHRFSEKEKRKMLDNMQGRKSPKENKDPHAEYEAAFYRLKGQDGYGFPILAFKAATIGAARFYDKSVSMTALKQFLFFSGQPGEDGMGMAVIEGEPEMREDVVRVNRGGADLRYRPIFHEWTTSLTVTYVRRVQASELIRSVRVVYREGDDESPSRSVRAFHAVRDEEGHGYEAAEDVAADPIKRAIVLRDMEREWHQMHRRYGDFEEFVKLGADDLGLGEAG